MRGPGFAFLSTLEGRFKPDGELPRFRSTDCEKGLERRLDSRGACENDEDGISRDESRFPLIDNPSRGGGLFDAEFKRVSSIRRPMISAAREGSSESLRVAELVLRVDVRELFNRVMELSRERGR